MKCPKCGLDNPPEAQFCAICGSALAAPAGTLSPAVGAAYKHGWRQLWKHFPVLLLIGIVSFLIGVSTSLFSLPWRDLPAAAVLSSVLSVAAAVLVDGPLDYGVSFAYLRGARNEPVRVSDMFSVFANYWNAVVSYVLIALITLGGLLLLIVPGIIFACRLAFVPFLVVERKMSATSAIKESWRISRGHTWKVFLLGLLSIPIALAGLLALLVGVIPAVMWITMAFASLYHAVSSSSPPFALAPAAPAPGPLTPS